jgi:hypothetical protein
MAGQQTERIIWMAEEVDFNLDPAARVAATAEIKAFLDSAGNPELEHSIVRPSDNIGDLEAKLREAHAERPFSAVVDLTRGKLSGQLNISDEALPTWNDFSMSRVRMATRPDLPTSGHLISHNAAEIRDALGDVDTSHLLVLDDTAFSGSTSVLAEGQLRRAFPDRDISFTHGFLILNTGDLGPKPGPVRRLAALGSRAIGGREFATPGDDGWHIFDIVRQPGEINAHLTAVMGLVRAMRSPDGGEKVKTLLGDAVVAHDIFPNAVRSETLLGALAAGHFLPDTHLNGDLHTRNPQLLPAIIAQGHILPPEHWRDGEHATLTHLVKLANMMN